MNSYEIWDIVKGWTYPIKHNDVFHSKKIVINTAAWRNHEIGVQWIKFGPKTKYISLLITQVWGDFMFSVRFHRRRVHCRHFCLSHQSRLCNTSDIWDKESIGQGYVIDYLSVTLS